MVDNIGAGLTVAEAKSYINIAYKIGTFKWKNAICGSVLMLISCVSEDEVIKRVSRSYKLRHWTRTLKLNLKFVMNLYKRELMEIRYGK